MAECLRPVVEHGIDILVENNHTSKGTPYDPLKSSYGCSPTELVGWRDALIERLGKGNCHLRFDVGHARNNMPVSEEYPLGKWYMLIGNEIKSYHLHQTVLDKVENCMKNHHPIMGLHNGLVSFDGFLWAWHCGILNHAPIILEIREGEGACTTWSRLQHILRQSEERIWSKIFIRTPIIHFAERTVPKQLLKRLLRGGWVIWNLRSQLWGRVLS